MVSVLLKKNFQMSDKKKVKLTIKNLLPGIDINDYEAV